MVLARKKFDRQDTPFSKTRILVLDCPVERILNFDDCLRPLTIAPWIDNPSVMNKKMPDLQKI